MSASAREVLGDWILDRDIQLRAGESVNKQADQIIAALSAAGFVVVPREPTEEMLRASTMLAPTWDDDASRRKWSAMLSAAEGKK